MGFPIIPVAVVGGAGALGLLALAMGHRRRDPLDTSGDAAPPVKAGPKVGKPGGGLGAATQAALQLGHIQGEVAQALVKAAGGNVPQQQTAGVAAFLNPAGFAVTGALVTRDLTDKALKALGVQDPAVRNQAGQLTGIAVGVGAVAGAPAVVAALAIKGLAEGANALEGLVLGAKAAKDTRNFVKQFDPTATGTPAAAIVQGVSKLLGLGPKPVPDTPAMKADRLTGTAAVNAAVAAANARGVPPGRIAQVQFNDMTTPWPTEVAQLNAL